MPTLCSICNLGEETARVINEALARRETLDQISKAVGIHRSTIDRHKKGRCPFSFPSYKAAKIKSRNKPLAQNSRLVVCWPDVPFVPRGFTLFPDGEEISTDKLNASDVLLKFELPKNRPALLIVAEAEDAERIAEPS
jgi:hypothetical protein